MAEARKLTQNIWMLSRQYGDIAGVDGVKDVCRQLAERQRFVLVCDPHAPGATLQLYIEMPEPDRQYYEVVRFCHRTVEGIYIFLVDSERYRQKRDIYA